MECFCYPRKHQDLLSDVKKPCERRFRMPLNGPVLVFLSGAVVEYHPISAKDISRLHQSVLKSCQLYSLDMRCTRCESGKETYWSQTSQNWRKMDESDIHGKSLNVKEVLTPMRGEKLRVPIADGTVKLSGGDQDLRTSTLIRDSPDRGEEQDNLRGESDGSSSTSLRDS